MQYLPAILYGLISTLFISFISLIIAIIPSYFLFWGRISSFKIMKWLCIGYVGIFDGIPVLAQLFFVYYALPAISPNLNISTNLTAIIILTINAIAGIVNTSYKNKETIKTSNIFMGRIKILVLSSILEFGRIIKYSTLLSVIAFKDLLRTANTFMMSSNDISVLIAAIVIYLMLSVIIKVIHIALEKVFFIKESTISL